MHLSLGTGQFSAYNPLESPLLLARVGIWMYLASWPEKCVAIGHTDVVTILSVSRAAAILSQSMWVPPSFHCGPCPGIERRGAGAALAPCRHPSRALAWRSFRWMEALNMWKCQRWLALTSERIKKMRCDQIVCPTNAKSCRWDVLAN